MTHKEKAAELMYQNGYTQQRISGVLGVSERTISTWKKKGDWDKKQNEYIFNKEQSEASIWKIINFQSRAIAKMAELNRKRLDEETDPDKIKTMLISSAELDGLKKLASSISTKEATASDYLGFITELCEWCAEEDIETAKIVSEACDQFIKTKLSALGN